MKTTTKVQKFTRTKTYTDNETGEIIPVIESKIEQRDFNFHKLWLQNMITSMTDITNKKMQLAFWIIEHLNKENQLIYTQRQMAEETGLSRDTVRLTMASLIKSDFLRRINSGCYMVNPNIIFKGNVGARMGLVFDYSECSSEKAKREREEMNKVISEAMDTSDEQDNTENENSYEEML